MLKDVTLGQYYPAESVIHRLDPRVKLAGTLLYLISLFLFQGPLALAVATAFLISLIILSSVPFSYMVKGLRTIIIILIITAAMNLFFTTGTVIVQFGIFKLTYEGIQMAILMMIRLVYLILGTSLMTLTTTPNQLTDGLEKGLRGLGKIGVPVHEIAMMMSIALRFIPILIEETEKIMKAQTARGADFESGGLIKKSKALIPLMVPLFVSAFRRANDLALAMEARCYHGGDGRSRMKPLTYTGRDAVGYIVVLAAFAGVVALSILSGRKGWRLL